MDDATTMRSSTAQQEGLAGAGFGFDQSIPPGGYRWWYVDGFSECGQFGATVIAFIGSVFSPYYFRARRNGAGVATEHVSLNVILYGQTKARWCMTERGSASLQQSSECLHIGPSAVRATNEGLLIDVAERATPLGQRVNGQIKLGFVAPLPDCFELDAAGEHWWADGLSQSVLEGVGLLRFELRYQTAGNGICILELVSWSCCWRWLPDSLRRSTCRGRREVSVSGNRAERLHKAT
jgi:hypothetical protein